MLPDKLQHKKLVEIGIQQGSCNRVEFPVVIMCPLRKVHDHALLSSAAVVTKSTKHQLFREWSLYELEVQIGGEVNGQTLGFTLNSSAHHAGEPLKWLDVNQ